jgi:acyl-CoA thioester hydrolase
MSGWVDGYRGAVNAWECDQFGHMNVQFYLGKSIDALAWMAAALGLGPQAVRERGLALVPVADRILFKRELRAGDGFHIRSAVRAANDQALALATEVLNSETGELAAQLEREARVFDLGTRRFVDLPAELHAAAEQRDAVVNLQPLPPVTPAAPAHDAQGLIDTSRGTFNQWELDASGHAHLRFRMNAYTSAMPHLMARVGFTTEAREQNGWGFAALDYKLAHVRPIKVGEPYEMRSGLYELKDKTMRMVHHMVQAMTGEPLGRLEFVVAMFDLAARRTMPIPPEMRAKAEALRIA